MVAAPMTVAKMSQPSSNDLPKLSARAADAQNPISRIVGLG